MAQAPPLHPLFLLLLLLSFAPAATAAAFTGLDAFLAAAAARDPFAANDTFGSLPASILRPLSAPSQLLPSRLLSLSATVPVTVHLAGASSPASSETVLPSLVSSAVSSSRFLSSRRPHRLALSHSIDLDAAARAALSQLASRAAAAVRAHLDASPAPFQSNALSSVPYSLVGGRSEASAREFVVNRAPSVAAGVAGMEGQEEDGQGDPTAAALSSSPNDSTGSFPLELSAHSLYLKRCYETLTEENRRLHKELAELCALKTAHPFYMHLPATTLFMCPSCELVASNPASASLHLGPHAALAAASNAAVATTEHRPSSFAALFSVSLLDGYVDGWDVQDLAPKNK